MSINEEKVIFKKHNYFLLGLSFLILFSTSYYSYLLFHSLAEIYSIVISFGIFVIIWNSRKFSQNNFFTIVGISFLCVGMLDLFHTLAYQGMEIFPGQGSNLAAQLWIAARFIQSISFLLAVLVYDRVYNHKNVLIIYLFVFVFVMYIIFCANLFPDCFVEETGLTPFKKISEIIISLIYISAIYFLHRIRNQFSVKIVRYIVTSIIFSILSELVFITYISVYDYANMLGHFLKIISFYIIYKTIIQIGFLEPYELLFRDLNERNEKINEQKELLQKANSTKDKFFSIIAHDLKSPFNALLSSSNLLIDDFDQLSVEERNELAKNINSTAKKLFELLNNLLQWSRAQTESIEFNPQINDLNYIVLSEISLMTPNAENKGIQLISLIEEETNGYFDENMISIVIRNLISNAIKFTNDGGVVRIEAKMSGDYIELSVKDSGVGMKESDINNLFRIDKKFSREGTRGEHGTGLGLVITKEFIDRNKGRIEVESEVGKGSCFKIILPRKKYSR